MTSMLPNYMYDNEGKRTVKQHSGSEAVYTNSAEAGVRTEAPHYSLYANPYFVMNDGDKYTEHIYIGSERIAVRVAKLSDESSVLGNFDEEEMAGQDIVVGGIDYGVKREAQEQVIEDCYDSLQYAYLLVDRRDLVNIGMVPSDADTSDVDDSDDERGTANPDTEWKKVYYYCTDHLGSTRLVLDSNGQIAEKLMFLPTGEVFRDKQISSLYHSDFLFSGKELDAETGNYYFGARYLAPRLGIWLSPDPMQLKYPHVSSYAYCMGNPINRYDLNGMYSLGSFIAPYQSYSVIAVFPSNYSDDEAINKDYTHAVMAKMPIILVDNILDFGNAMYALSAMGTNTNTYTINSHGSSGDNAHFYIGTEEVSATTSFFNLYEGLKEKNVFIGACNIGTMYGTGYQIVENMAKQTSSTVIAPSHSVYAGYDYDGGYGLNGMKVPYLALPNYDDYIISTKGSYAEPIKNVTIDKYNGIHWDSNPTVVIPYDYQNLSK